MAKRSRSNSLRILMLASEIVPYAKSGGLADAVSSLLKQLDELGHDVRLIMPRYYFVRRERLYRYPSPLAFTVGSRQIACGLYEGRLQTGSAVVYFLDVEELYGRDGIYGDSGGEFADNLRRFSVLAYAAFAVCEAMEWIPDVFHAHDWPAALLPLLLRKRRTSERWRRCASVLTIHNIGYQGVFPVEQLPATGIGWPELNESRLLHLDRLNLLHCGVSWADMVTTVSPQYANDIQTPTGGFGLDLLLKERASSLAGVLNGVDYSVWSPEADPYTEVPFTAETLALKGRIKERLRDEMGLPHSNAPLFGMVSRLVSQKGFEELASPGFGAFPALLTQTGAQFVVVGSGEERYEHYLRSLAARFPQLRVRIGFDERLAHLVEAGADFFLMPSRYEPCGLNQLYSLRYGTVPVVTRTGGLADTVEESSPKGGTGFFIESCCPQAILQAVVRAISVYQKEPARIEAMRRAGMKKRFSWESSAKRYVAIYTRAIDSVADATG